MVTLTILQPQLVLCFSIGNELCLRFDEIYHFVSQSCIFRTFYSWIPLWGPVLAMLYLTRSSPAPARKKIDSFKEDFLDGEEGSLDKDSLLSSSNGVSHLGHIYDILDTKSLDRYDRLVDEGEVSGLGEIFTPEDAHHLLNHADRTGESATSQYPVSEYYFRDMKDMVSPQYNLDYEYILESPAYQPPDNQSLNS